MINTIIFDLDGTLLNTLDDLWASVNYSLAQNNMPLRNKDEIRSFLGNGARQLISLSLPSDQVSKHLSSTLSCFKTYYSQHSLDNTEPYEGIITMLSSLRAKGYKTGIVSNKPDFAVQQLYKRYFLPYVDIAIGDQSGYNRKPSPDLVYKALECLKSQLSESIYVGDSEVDILTAQNCGLRCLSVSWGFRDRKYLESNGATEIIDHPSLLIEHIN